MEKKGLSYIDWSISFGIFLISVIMLFILAKPYLTQDYSNEYLLSIAKQGLEDYAYAEISVFPLFVDSDQNKDSQITNAKLPSYSNLFEYGEKIVIVDSNFNLMGGYEIVDSGPKKINFDTTNLEKYVNVFYVLYFDVEDFSYSHSLPSLNEKSCGPEAGDLDCTFGIEEKRKGFFMEKFNELDELIRSEDDYYIEFKEKMKYPETKNLIITINGENDLNYNFSFVEPTESDNIHVLSWGDYSLNEYGKKGLVNITIKVW